MTNWMPIESAPKDGTEILGWHSQDGQYGEAPGAIVVAWSKWISGGWSVCGVGGWEMEQDRTNITHWMPIPAPPNTLDKLGDGE